MTEENEEELDVAMLGAGAEPTLEENEKLLAEVNRKAALRTFLR